MLCVGPECDGCMLGAVQVGWSVEGLTRVQRQAQELLPRLFPLQADCFPASAPHTLQPVHSALLTLAALSGVEKSNRSAVLNGC